MQIRNKKSYGQHSESVILYMVICRKETRMDMGVNVDVRCYHVKSGWHNHVMSRMKLGALSPTAAILTTERLPYNSYKTFLVGPA